MKVFPCLLRPQLSVYRLTSLCCSLYCTVFCSFSSSLETCVRLRRAVETQPRISYERRQICILKWFSFEHPLLLIYRHSCHVVFMCSLRRIKICSTLIFKQIGERLVHIPASALLTTDNAVTYCTANNGSINENTSPNQRIYDHRQPPLDCSAHAFLAAYLTRAGTNDEIAEWRATWPRMEDQRILPARWNGNLEEMLPGEAVCKQQALYDRNILCHELLTLRLLMDSAYSKAKAKSRGRLGIDEGMDFS